MTSFSLTRFSFFCLMAIAVALFGCASTSGGTSSTAVTGAAGGGASVGASDDLERCAEPLGTLAVDDGGGTVHGTEVMTVEPLLRLAVQQSNCFVITSIGNQRTEGRMQKITDKQRDSGEFRAGSNQQKGQRVAADFFLEPTVIIKNSPTSGIGAGLGGLLGGGSSRVAAGVAGAMESKSSVVTLALFDIRSGIQLSISEGSSTSTNFGAAMSAFGTKAGGALGGYSKTPEGKATVAAFLDAYNKMVISLRNYKAQDVKGGLGTGGRLKVN